MVFLLFLSKNNEVSTMMREDNRRGPPRGGGGFDRSRSFSGPREMHKAVCGECGVECEVPFKPTEGKPVFCRDCYRKKNPRF